MIYEGEYLNGKRNEKGKSFDKDGKIIFEGEFFNNNELNGIANVNYNDEIISESAIYEYRNGKINGKVKIYYNDNLHFEGEYLYNYKLRGKLYIKGNIEYNGEFLYGKKWNGNGYDESGKIVYTLKNGNGGIKEYNFQDELIYKGEYLNGKRNGKGKNYKDNKIIFEGEYKNGLLWCGKEYLKNQLIFEGEYKKCLRWNGKGKEYDDKDKLKIEFEYIYKKIMFKK